MQGALPVRETKAGWLVQAPAKVNLHLEVLGKRADGFHALRTLLCPVRWGDTLLLKPVPGEEGRIDLSVHDCLPGELAGDTPSDDTNLVVQALRAIWRSCGATFNCSVRLWKRVPPQAGLGGGSSDAAAALVAANRIWRLGLSTEKLIDIAAQVGSDIPGLLFRHATLCEGRGERVTPAPVPGGIPVVIAKLRGGLSTAEVFGQYRAEDREEPKSQIQSLLQALRQGKLQELPRLMANQLQAAAQRVSDSLSELSDLFSRLPFAVHQLTGSGSAWFGFCHNHRQAARAAASLRGQGVPWAIATCVG